MSSTPELLRQIKKPKANTFKRAKIKRRDAVTGLFESTWLDISSDVKSYGKIKQEVDPARLYTFSFSNAKLVVANDEGFYNPEDNEASLWYGYLNQQRTLVQIEAGFLKTSLASSGNWVTTEYPNASLYDEDIWDDEDAIFDNGSNAVQFTGIISGDIVLSDKNEVVLNVKPLTSVFQDYPANILTGWTSTGFTASNFIALLRDQTDGSGSFVFRPFFGDTTSNWNITSTTNIYSNLNAPTATGVIDKTVWDIITKLAEAEDYVPYASKDGNFNFVPRTPTTDVAFQFHGAGSFNTTYGNTIKSIQSYGRKITKYYSQVNVKFVNSDTSTSYYSKTATFSVSGSNTPWTLGLRKLDIENYFIPNTATAQAIGDNIFNEYSALKNEITFTTSLVPHLDLLDRISITYDPSEVSANSLWDQSDWAADDTSTSTDLVFDSSRGDSIKIQGDEFKFLSIETDIDNMQNVFIAREI
jgi:hypothetical protein